MKRGGIFYKERPVELLSEIEEYDEDVIKLSYHIVCKETKEKLHRIDWSPYSDMTLEDLKLYLELGCPSRIGRVPLNKDDLNQIKRHRDLVQTINTKLGDRSLDI